MSLLHTNNLVQKNKRQCNQDQTNADRSAQENYPDVIFNAKNLCWGVGSLKILKNLNFSVKTNQLVGIIGPNGAGKSSLLRCLFAKNKITKGSLTFFGSNIEYFSRKELSQYIAVVLQEPPSQFSMNVFELVSMGLIPHQSLLSFSTQLERQSIKNAIDSVGLIKKINSPFNTLSGGEKQRVLLARAIVQKTKVLILDEPTNHLDIQHQIDILHLIKSMEITVLISIHDINMASAFCDQVILMDQGEIVKQGECQSVITENNLKQVFKVEAKVDNNPFHSGQRISYDFIKSINRTKNEKNFNEWQKNEP